MQQQDLSGARATVAVLFSTAFLYGCPEGGVDLPETIIPNADPIAVAGPDQELDASERANLDGSGSSDPDGDFFTYEWTLQSAPPGSAAEIMLPTAAEAYFDTDEPGTYVAQLTVEDNFGGSDTDTLTVTAEDTGTLPPVANAGPDQTVTYQQGGITVFLDGSNSSDPDGDPITFAWEITEFIPDGALPMTPVTLIDPDTALPSFDVFELNQLGVYTIELTVSDGTLQDTDTVVITVEKAMPTASILFGSGLIVVGSIFGLRRRWRWRW